MSLMNVLQFICPTGFYGAERWILALAKHLPRDSVRCDLAVTLEDNSKDLELVRQYRNLGMDAFELPMAHRFDYKVVNRLADLIKSRDIHVIHTHGYKSDILGVLAARKAGIPCIVTPHGFENASDLKLRLFIWLGCQSMKYADVVAPLSPALMEDVKKIGVPDSKITYIQNGVDLSEAEAELQNDRTLATPGTKRIGFIGQLISRKNLWDMLEVFESFASKHDNVTLSFLGDGDEREALEQKAKTLKHGDRIEFLGFRDDRMAYLRSFDMFAMTSTLEGIPRCLMEAAAMGVPVSAYDIPGIDQLVFHENTGLLAPLGDKDKLEAQWERMLFDEPLAKTLAENAKDYVYQHYSAQRMAEEYRQLFERVIKKMG
ncbi:glycosyltransferase [Hahella sp. CCB-MM4]|uniref:glycosyltransferase family 4 protein n=1 Tax=Hahella sp. (strain CCB-MM4) TaxID=1926491 RepID=UPI000BC40803|nr:glycosyltransferase family 4 protein [Hahella sp. CCB-MM4]OZG73436.1 glycosyltransferase [Hahella sp. CCB-MM4]